MCARCSLLLYVRPPRAEVWIRPSGNGQSGKIFTAHTNKQSQLLLICWWVTFISPGVQLHLKKKKKSFVDRQMPCALCLGKRLRMHIAHNSKPTTSTHHGRHRQQSFAMPKIHARLFARLLFFTTSVESQVQAR